VVNWSEGAEFNHEKKKKTKQKNWTFVPQKKKKKKKKKVLILNVAVCSGFENPGDPHADARQYRRCRWDAVAAERHRAPCAGVAAPRAGRRAARPGVACQQFRLGRCAFPVPAL
jgi:hypothetical protein